MANDPKDIAARARAYLAHDIKTGPGVEFARYVVDHEAERGLTAANVLLNRIRMRLGVGTVADILPACERNSDERSQLGIDLQIARQKLVDATAEIERLRGALPWPYNGHVAAVHHTECAHPDQALAVFSYADEAAEWARRYAKWDGARADVPLYIRIRTVAVDPPAKKAPTDE